MHAGLKPQFSSVPLDEGAEPGYGFAENQVLYLEGPFVGVERFRIGKEAGNVVVCDDAITAQKLPRPRHGLAALGGGERLVTPARDKTPSAVLLDVLSVVRLPFPAATKVLSVQ